MFEFLAAIILFIMAHLLPMQTSIKRGLIEKMGQVAFIVIYSLQSTLFLIWIYISYRATPYIQIWPRYEWATWIPVIGMPFALLLIVAGLTSPNPFSLGWNLRGYDPHKPGIVSITRHPLFWGLALWGILHIPANGDAATVILFLTFSIFSLFGTISLEHKRQQQYSPELWIEWSLGRSNIPFMGSGEIDAQNIGWSRVVATSLLYLILTLIHPYFLDVPTPLNAFINVTHIF